MVEGKHYVYIVYLDTPEGEDIPLWVGQGAGGRWKDYRHNTSNNKDLQAMVSWCRENGLLEHLRPEKVEHFATRDEALDLEEELILLHGRRDLGTGPLFNRTGGGKKERSEIGRLRGRIQPREAKARGGRIGGKTGSRTTNAMRIACPNPGCTVVTSPGPMARHAKVCPYRPGA